MTKFVRTLFALVVMGLVATALTVAALNWMGSRPGAFHFATEETPQLEIADGADRDAGLSRP